MIWYMSFPLAFECSFAIFCPFLIIPSSFPGPYSNGIYFLLILFYNFIYSSLLNLNFPSQIKFHLNYHLLFLSIFGLWYCCIVFSLLALLQLPTMKTNLVVLFLVYEQPSKSASKYPSKITSFLLKHNVVLEVPLK